MDARKNSWLSRMGIVILAAVLMELISIAQYERIRKVMQEEMTIRSRVVMGSRANLIQHTLEITEVAMQENLYDIRRSMAHPDSLFPAMVRLIDGNPQFRGGCLALAPYYYPSMGRLFEPYASKDQDGKITLQQLGGPDHDYTQNEEYLWVLEHRTPSWTDPYFYGPDSLSFSTYSYPIMDAKGDVIAVCGMDIDLSWLGDTLNMRQPFPSSFCLLLTQEGELVAGPSESHIPKADVHKVVEFMNGRLQEQDLGDYRVRIRDLIKDPYWKLVQAYKMDEVYARMRRLRRMQMLFILLGLAILTFLIERYAHNEKRLRKASEEQARLSGELAVAGRIQQEMLPKTFPPFIYASLEPAREVGGDLFDFFVRDGKLFFCIGDVSGKGAPSAMLMSVAHSLFRMLLQKEENPSWILQTMNRELCRGNDTNMFLTFLLGCLDLYSGELRFANAGHDKPFVITDSVDQLPTKSNLPLGIYPDIRFEQQSCTLSPGTTLLLYTDGLTESKNPDRELFMRSGVISVIQDLLQSGELAPQKLVSSLSQAAHRFTGTAPQSDDLTMMAIRFEPGETLREQIQLVNQLDEVNRLSPFVKEYLAKLPISAKTAAGLRLALEEAVVNVLNYAYPAGEEGTVQILADSNLREVRFTIIDSGVPFDPTTVLEADITLDAQSRPIGGLGVLLTRKLTDSISYNRRDGKNVLTLTKTIV